MQRNAKVVAVDGPYRMEVQITFKSHNGLTRDEVDSVARKPARKTADAVRELPYVDFGPEKTRIEM